MLKYWQIWGPVWAAEDGTGGGEGADANEGEGEGSPDSEGGEGGQDHWLSAYEDVDEAGKEFVGTRSPADLIKYAKQQREAASRRADDLAKDGGYIKMPEPDANAEAFQEHFKAYQPEDPKIYQSIAGFKDGEMSATQQAEVDAAHVGSLHPEQYRAFVAEKERLIGEANQAAAKELVEELQSSEGWGADFERNGQVVDRAVKQLGLGEDFVKAISDPHAGFSKGSYKAMMEGLLKVGSFLQEGGPLGDNDASLGGMSAKDELSDLEGIEINGGSLTASQKTRKDALLQKIAEGKANEPA